METWDTVVVVEFTFCPICGRFQSCVIRSRFNLWYETFSVDSNADNTNKWERSLTNTSITTYLQNMPQKLINLIDDALKLNDAHFRQSSFKKLDYRLKTDALLYELLVVAEQYQCHLQYHFLALEKYQIWHRYNTTDPSYLLHNTTLSSLIILSALKTLTL